MSVYRTIGPLVLSCCHMVAPILQHCVYCTLDVISRPSFVLSCCHMVAPTLQHCVYCTVDVIFQTVVCSLMLPHGSTNSLQHCVYCSLVVISKSSFVLSCCHVVASIISNIVCTAFLISFPDRRLFSYAAT